MSAGGESFPLAPMSRSLMVMTLVLLALPLGFLAAAALGLSQLMGPGLLMVIIYGWIRLRFRPTRFVVRPDVVEVVWPLKRRRIARAGIASVRLIDRLDLKCEVGWGMRVGAGGRWGGVWVGGRRVRGGVPGDTSR